MMEDLEIPNYTVQDRLYDRGHTLAYRAIRNRDNKKVLIKTVAGQYPDPKLISALEHEYQLLTKLNVAGTITAIELVKHGGKTFLVLEDIYGQTLKQFLTVTPFKLSDFFLIAIQLVKIISALHKNHIIHKDINPNNIIINPETLKITLIDFNISTKLSFETQEALNPTVLEGTLAYISPEQTGRLNRLLDYRTDFYSLGVTLFELLTKQLPYPLDDAMEVIHSHIAKPIPDASAINSEVPPQLSAIVSKLMAKDPEDRYRSSEGLLHDLEESQAQWVTHRMIKPFPLGEHDYSDVLTISQKLYGREEQIQLLLNTFARVSQGRSELTLVSGYSGIGKTSLVNQVHKPITEKHGYFTKGKFDQLKKTTPYNAFIKAFQDLVKQTLAEPEEKLKIIKEDLLNVLGSNGKIITDVIPEVEFIIGKQPDVVTLDATETQNRFQILFQNFVHVFAQREHPLVIFLDDLQWADNASLKLIELLISDVNAGYLLLVGTYRDNEVSSDHPLMLTLESLYKMQANINQIQLEPLTFNDITQLLIDTLHATSEEVKKLTDLILSKTAGNPFFINEFLRTLKQENLLVFSQEEKKWNWDIIKIQEKNITNNVLELIEKKIDQLDNETKQLIQLASCIGNSFDLNVLSIISEKKPQDILKILFPTIENNFLLLLGNEYKQIEDLAPGQVIAQDLLSKVVYKFLHDRVQQTIYFSIKESQRKQIHLNIGRLLLQQQSLEDNEERLFTVLNHFNSSLDLIIQEEERKNIAKYNLQAGMKAKESTAYQAALQYLNAGLQLLRENAWEENYGLAFSLNKEIAECNHLVGQFERADMYFTFALNNATNKFDKLNVYETKISLLSRIGKFQEALTLGLEALALFNIHLPFNPNKLQLLKAIFAIRVQLGYRKPAELELPAMTDPEQFAVSSLMATMLNAAYIFNPSLFIVLGCKMLSISLKYGYSKFTHIACMAYAIVIINGLNQYDTGFQFIELFDKVVKKISDPPGLVKSKSGFNFFLCHWKYPMVNNLPHLMKYYKAALEVGDLVYAEYNLGIYANILLDLGRPLAEVANAANNLLTFLVRIKTHAFHNFYQGMADFANYLQNDKTLTATQLLATTKKIAEGENKTEISYLFCLAVRIYFMLGNYKEAIEFAEKRLPYAEATQGILFDVKTETYYALALAAEYTTANKKERAHYLKKLKKIQKKLSRWSKWMPANFNPDYLLVTAEICRIKNEILLAANFYEQAINNARDSDFTHLMAIANEATYRFYSSINKEKIAKLYLLDAHYAYERWGANTKSKSLEQSYPTWFTLDKSRQFTETTTTGISTMPSNLDFLSILKTLQAISGEIDSHTLLQKLMRALLENAGAETGMFLVNHAGHWFIEAEIKYNQTGVTLTKIPLDKCTNLPLTLINYVKRTNELILINDTHASNLFMQDPYIVRSHAKSILAMPIIQHNEALAIVYLENNATTEAFTEDHLVTLKLLAGQVAISLENAQLYAAGKRFVPFEFLLQLNKRSLAEVALGDHIQKKFSILFCDIRGFTKFSETLTPAETFKFINKFLSLLEPIIREHKGFIDKYIGDAILALFYQETDAALDAGITIQKHMRMRNSEYIANHQNPIIIGVGINTGDLMLGIIGSEERIEGSVIGDAVNVASYIEHLTREYNTPLLISGNTKASLINPEKYTLRLIDVASIKGRVQPVEIWEVCDGYSEEVRQLKKSSLELFNQALLAYRNKDFGHAAQLFQQCLTLNPADTVVLFYLRKCRG